MDRRIHEVLDGDRDRAELTADERRRLEAYEEAITGALTPLARHEEVDVTASVMSRIRPLRPGAAPATSTETAASARERVSALGAAWRWLWRPRDVRVRPAWGLAVGAAAFAFVLAGPSGPADISSPPDGVAVATTDTRPADRSTVLVQFRLDANDARSVHVVGDFTDWQPAHAMNEVAPGVWSVVVALEPGVHDYAFVVDGEQWRPDPLAPSVDDGFGGTNSRLALLPPDRRPTGSTGAS